MPTPPSFRKVNPADLPIFYLALTSPTLPLSAVDEYAETLLAQRISMISGRGAGAGVRRAEIRGAHPGRPQPAGRPRHRHRRGAATPSTSTTSTCPPAPWTGRSEPSTVQAKGQLWTPPPTARSSSPTATAPRCAWTTSARVIDSVENNKVASLVQRRARHRARHPAPARHQHHRGRGRHQEAAAHVPRRSSRRRWT